MKEKQKNVNQKKGISLIVLVITIIVIVILAVAVILSMADNNPISNANKAKFQNDMKSIQEEVELVKASNYANSQGKSAGTIDFATLSSASKYQDKLFEVAGQLCLNSDLLTAEEKGWADELGIKRSTDGFIYSDDKSTIIGYNGIDTELVIPLVSSIGDDNNEPFMNNKNITKIEIAEGVEGIGDQAFAGCSNATIILPKKLPLLGSNSFSNVGGIKVFRESFSDSWNNTIFITEKGKKELIKNNPDMPDWNIVEIESGYYVNDAAAFSAGIPTDKDKISLM